MSATTKTKQDKSDATPAAPAIDQAVENRIRNQAFAKIGGVPKNYDHTTVTQITARSYRVNVYPTNTAGEFNIIKQKKIEYSLILQDN
jgi:hypothetical protein